MNIYEVIAASWAALDVLLIIAWHVAHVLVRGPRAASVPTRPAPVPNHPATAPKHRALVNAH